MKNLSYHLGQLKEISRRYIIREDEQVIVVEEFLGGGSSMEWIDEDIAKSIELI